MLYAAVFVIILIVGTFLHFAGKGDWKSYGGFMATGGWVGVAVVFGGRMLKLLPP